MGFKNLGATYSVKIGFTFKSNKHASSSSMLLISIASFVSFVPGGSRNSAAEPFGDGGVELLDESKGQSYN